MCDKMRNISHCLGYIQVWKFIFQCHCLGIFWGSYWIFSRCNPVRGVWWVGRVIHENLETLADFFNNTGISDHVWLVVDLPLWKIMDFVSWDEDIPPKKWKVIKFRFQTTNQTVKHWMILDVCFVAQRGHCGHGDIITRVWMLETLDMNASPSHVAKQHQ